MEGMVESGTGGEKRKGSASTPREVPSNFSAVVAPMSTSRISHFCIWGLRRYSARCTIDRLTDVLPGCVASRPVTG